MEVALTAAKRAKVTVVGMEDAPFTAILGPAIGNGIRKASPFICLYDSH